METPEGPWDDVLRQVRVALDGVLSPGDAGDELMDGLREALEAISEGNPAASTFTSARVEVVDGGRGEDEPIKPGVRPVLRVAGGEESPERPGPRVTVVKLPRREPIGGPGRVAVREAERQALWAGPQLRTYRIYCHKGRFQVELEGVVVTSLRAGQSVDVGGRKVGVVGEKAGGRGSYRRLRR